MTNMSIQPLWLTHFIEILLVLEFQLTKFIVGAFSYKAHFRPQISSNDDQFFVETKDFIHGKVDWFKNPIPAPDNFEEGNMANISPTVKINISTNPDIVEEIMLGTSCSSKEVAAYKALFQEFCAQLASSTPLPTPLGFLILFP